MDANNLVNGEGVKGFANKKKKRIVFAIIIFAFCLLGIRIFPDVYKKIQSNPEEEDNTDYFAEVACHFINYENLDDDEMVGFIRTDGEICAAITIDNQGRSGNLVANLEPAVYRVANGLYDGYFEFEIKDPGKEYILEIDCNNGRMELKEAQLAYILCNHINYKQVDEYRSVYIESEVIGFMASFDAYTEYQQEDTKIIAGKYRISNSFNDEVIEIEVKEGESYTLDVDWKKGSIKFRKNPHPAGSTNCKDVGFSIVCST